MKILHISTAEYWRGGERQVHYLMKSLLDYPVEQFLLSPEKSKLKKVSKKNGFITMGMEKPSGFSLKSAKKIKAICSEFKIDLIHVHDSKAQTCAVLASIFYKNKVSILVTRRVLFPVTGVLSLFKYNYKAVKKVICISPAVQLEMNKILKKKNTVVINSCIDTHKYEQVSLKDFGLVKDKIKIAYVAALSHEKDHNTFIETAKLILKVRKDVCFYIVGSGKLENDIKHKIEKDNLEKDIHLMGFIDTIDALIPQMDLLLFTSKSEGLGSTILDFFLAKKPVISTRCGGNETLVIDNKTGMLCEVGDVNCLFKKTIEVLNNHKLQKTLTENAYSLVLNTFSIACLGKETFQVYKNIIKDEKIVF